MYYLKYQAKKFYQAKSLYLLLLLTIIGLWATPALCQKTNSETSSALYTTYPPKPVNKPISRVAKTATQIVGNVPVTATEVPVTAVQNSDRYYRPTPKLETILERSNQDIQDDLCARAAREVEASRILIKAQTETIETYREQAKSFKDVLDAKTVLVEEYKAMALTSSEIQARDAKIFDAYKEMIAIKDKEIAELKKAKKKSPFSRITDILIGVGIAAIAF